MGHRSALQAGEKASSCPDIPPALLWHKEPDASTRPRRCLRVVAWWPRWSGACWRNCHMGTAGVVLLLHACPGVTPSSIGGIAPLVSPRLERGAGRCGLRYYTGRRGYLPPAPHLLSPVAACQSATAGQPNRHFTWTKTLQVRLSTSKHSNTPTASLGSC